MIFSGFASTQPDVGGRNLVTHATLSLVMAAACSAANGSESMVNTETDKTSWCRLNPNGPSLESSGTAEELPNNSIHIVKREMQQFGQSKLKYKSFIRISKGEAANLAREIITVEKGNIYLVRAAAIFSNSEYYNNSIKLSASLYRGSASLDIYNFSLSGPGAAPQNIAIVVNTPIEIRAANAICQTAS